MTCICTCGPAALGLDLEQPDYDLDSEDETLLNRLNRKMEIKPLQFETMMDRLEKASTHQVPRLCEVTALSRLLLCWASPGSRGSDSVLSWCRCRRPSCC